MRTNPNRRKSVLWHVQNEGTVTVEQLSDLTGWPQLASRDALVKGCGAGYVQRLHPRTRPAAYGLTPAGIDEALKVDQSQVDFAARSNGQVAAAPIAPPAALGWAQRGDPQILHADELLCAINSKGELVIDLGDEVNVMVQVPPLKAFELRRFLLATTFLDDLHAKGAF